MAKQSKRSPTFAALAAQAKVKPSESDRWAVAYFKRHRDDDVNEACPGREYLTECPARVSAFMKVVVVQVAAAPPDKFAGGGYWEAMHGAMTGYFEIRKKYRGRHYRLFFVLDEESQGTKPLLTILCGMSKPDQTVFSADDYAWVKRLGDEYRARSPRSVI